MNGVKIQIGQVGKAMVRLIIAKNRRIPKINNEAKFKNQSQLLMGWTRKNLPK